MAIPKAIWMLRSNIYDVLGSEHLVKDYRRMELVDFIDEYDDYYRIYINFNKVYSPYHYTNDTNDMYSVDRKLEIINIINKINSDSKVGSIDIKIHNDNKWND